jgi:hypothetical protein
MQPFLRGEKYFMLVDKPIFSQLLTVAARFGAFPSRDRQKL